jgi:golgi-specific brefeldin A-resistance guanine nucleotide exchange factor 1
VSCYIVFVDFFFHYFFDYFSSAQNIHTQEDWAIVFTILECVGAGAMPPDYEKNLQLQQQLATGTKSDGALSSEDDSGLPDRGYISDSEIQLNQNKPPAPLAASATTTASCTPLLSPSGDNWILVG